MPSTACKTPREIKYTKTFLKAYKRCKESGRYNMPKVKQVLELLAHRQDLPVAYRDHALIGDWSGYRECHLGGDFLLIYQFDGDSVIIAAMLGSHNDCFNR